MNKYILIIILLSNLLLAEQIYTTIDINKQEENRYKIINFLKNDLNIKNKNLLRKNNIIYIKIINEKNIYKIKKKYKNVKIIKNPKFRTTIKIIPETKKEKLLKKKEYKKYKKIDFFFKKEKAKAEELARIKAKQEKIRKLAEAKAKAEELARIKAEQEKARKLAEEKAKAEEQKKLIKKKRKVENKIFFKEKKCDIKNYYYLEFTKKKTENEKILNGYIKNYKECILKNKINIKNEIKERFYQYKKGRKLNKKCKKQIKYLNSKKENISLKIRKILDEYLTNCIFKIKK
jgi:hypothetical protein